MTDKELEKLAKAAFPQGDTAYSETYWKQMESMLDGNGGKKGAIWWWAFGVGLVLLGLIGFVGYNFLENAGAKGTATFQLKEDQESTLQATKNTETRTPQNSEATKWSYPERSNMPEQNLNREPNTKAALLEENDANNNAIEFQEGKSKKNNAAKDGISQWGKTELGWTRVEQNSINGKNNSDQYDHDETFSAHRNPEVKSPSFSRDKEYSISFLTLREIHYQSSLPHRSLLNSDSQMANSWEDPAEVKKSKVNSFQFFIEAEGGAYPSLHVSSFVVNHIERAGDYSTFSPQKALTVSMGINAGIKWHTLYVQTGLHYAQMQQKTIVSHTQTRTKEELEISEKEELTSVDSSFVGHNIVKVTNGNGFSFQYQGSKWEVDSQFTTVTDTSKNITQYSETIREEHKYRLSYLQIPLYAGVEHQFKNRILIECQLGTQFGFKVGAKGEYFNPHTEKYQNLTAEGELSPVVIDGLFSLGVGYALSPQLSMRLRPRYSYQIVGPFKNREVSQKLLSPLALGLRLSMRYLF